MNLRSLERRRVPICQFIEQTYSRSDGIKEIFLSQKIPLILLFVCSGLKDVLLLGLLVVLDRKVPPSNLCYF